MSEARRWIKFAAAAMTSCAVKPKEAAKVADAMLKEFHARYEWDDMNQYWKTKE